MALFRIFKGPEEGLNEVPRREGYAYFTTDKGNFYIDIKSDEFAADGTTVTNAVGIRVQVNAKGAQGIFDGAGNLIDINDLMLADTKLEVDQGGTGAETLTLNAILVGNGTNPVKMISIDEGKILIGDPTDGVTGLSGIGALYATTANAPEFGTLPISVGGTGATTPAKARENLEVYSQTEVDDKVLPVTTTAWETTLFANQWVGTTVPFTYVYTNESITCGKAGNVPPIITYLSNRDEYSLIDSADIDLSTHQITFSASKKPTGDIKIIITDNR